MVLNLYCNTSQLSFCIECKRLERPSLGWSYAKKPLPCCFKCIVKPAIRRKYWAAFLRETGFSPQPDPHYGTHAGYEAYWT